MTVKITFLRKLSMHVTFNLMTVLYSSSELMWVIVGTISSYTNDGLTLLLSKTLKLFISS